MRNKALNVFVYALIALCQPVHAELVVNGGFETGDLTGWTRSFLGEGTVSVIDNPDYVHTSRYTALVESCCSNPPAILSQRLATTPGTQYELSFWAQISGLRPNYFAVSVDSTFLFQQENIPPQFPRDEMTFLFTATSPSTLLEFRSRYPDAGVVLDDISVTGHGAIPEPPTGTLIGSGIIGMLLLRDCLKINFRRRVV